MKKLILSFAALGVLLITVACSDTADVATNSSTPIETESESLPQAQTSTQIIEDVNAEKFQSLIASGEGVLLDVRTPGEFSGGYIDGATNMDFNSAEFEANLETLDKTKPVYVYCQSGGRSGRAKDMMEGLGFTAVYNLVGGYGSWPYKN